MKKVLFLLIQLIICQYVMAQVTVTVGGLDDVDTVALRQMFPPTIEENLNQQNVSFKISSPYTLTHNKECNTCDEIPCVIGSIVNVAHASLTHQDGNCEIYLITSYKGIHGNPGIIPDFMGGDKNMSIYNRIKSDLNWAVINIPRYANQYEIDELKLMMTNYPKKQARKNFNADYMLMYPLNFKRKKCRNKFSRGRCVVVGKDYRFVFFYFLMTDDSVKNFEQYLAQLKGMIRFN